MLEQTIQTKVIKYLESIGAKVINLKSASKKGNADLVICLRGRYVEFEMKQPGKHATRLQQYKAAETRAAGGAWFEIHSLDEAMEAIKSLDYGVRSS